MARRSRSPLGVFAPDARRRAIALSMKDSSNVTRAVAAILFPARNRLIPLCLLKAFLLRESDNPHTQGHCHVAEGKTPLRRAEAPRCPTLTIWSDACGAAELERQRR